MKITKYGHACVLVETGVVRILIDPGSWSDVPSLHNLDAILITHEHFDHLDTEKIQRLLSENLEAIVYTNEHVRKLLIEKGVSSTCLQNGDIADIKGVPVEGIGTEHAVIYGNTSPCENTGYLINQELFVPGDALSVFPSRPIRVLALPTSGPWMKLSEAIDYGKKIAPAIVFPIHDALYTEEVRRSMIPRLVGIHLESVGITFQDISDAETIVM